MHHFHYRIDIGDELQLCLHKMSEQDKVSAQDRVTFLPTWSVGTEMKHLEKTPSILQECERRGYSSHDTVPELLTCSQMVHG